ncbi:MAG: TIGR03915 family putative DNA repair protein [Oscillospiraceae bacterium]|nr:TIGR03915 family putative DNA repair protein [Oscillospiraceae bacterium]
MERQLFYRYQYDGSFSGFLCCVFESYSKKEIPCAFSSGEDMQMALYPQRIIETNREHALRVYRALRGKISPEAQNLVACGFLSCSPERDKVLYRFIRRGFETGGSIMRQFSHPDVEPLMNIARAAGNEAQLLRGFIRFSEVGGAFAAEIEPKNRVLPLLRKHFCARYADEIFMVYDCTHREALLYRPGHWAIIPLEEFQMADPDEKEKKYRRLWKRFYDTIAIEERYNPACRRSHMPKRYWNKMMEFIPNIQSAGADAPPLGVPSGKPVPVRRP